MLFRSSTCQNSDSCPWDAMALNTSQTPRSARALPPGASRLFHNATTEGMTPGIALPIQSPSSLESAHILLVGKYFEHHPWLEDPPVQAQLPFRVSCHIQSFSVWASSFLHPSPCPLPQPQPKAPFSLSAHPSLHHSRALPPPRRATSTPAPMDTTGGSERDREQAGLRGTGLERPAWGLPDPPCQT